MTKISVTGSKKDLESVIEELHQLEALDIEDYQGEELERGDPFEEAEDISELLVDVRSLISKLPETEQTVQKSLSLEELQDKIPGISDKVEEINREFENIDSEIDSIGDKKQFFRKLEGTGLDYESLKGSDTLSVFIGKIDVEHFRSEAPNDCFEIYNGKDADVVVYYREYQEKFDRAIDSARIEQYSLIKTDLQGQIESIIGQLKSEKKQLKAQKKDKKEELKEIASDWKGSLESIERFLSEKVEKSEAPIRFATTESAFIAKGWIPSERYNEVEEKIADVAEGRIHIQKEEGEEPPIKHENNRAVQPFESLTDLVSVPRYNELDPSFMLLLTFPLFFGFMIGDAGYGLTTLAVFYGGMKLFPKAADIFKSLMYASIATIIFGLAFGDAFGFIIFGNESALTQLTGIGLFSQIPILFHRAHHLGQVFEISILIGLVHVNLGYLLGFYNEYVNHGIKEAFLEKGSWWVLQAGFALWYFVGMTAGLPVVALSLALLYLGEGVEGIVEIPALLSNILSYLRIFGVSVAAISLAGVVNSMANPLFQSGSALGITLGVVLLVFGHTFNTFVKIMEGFLQGIRLHYVEQFGKFYEGGGKKYAPFGAKTR
jgi:V/A-type H+-transporting ATPase subunit I